MPQTLTADLYEGESNIVLKCKEGLTLDISNKVTRNTSEIYSIVEENRFRVDINETVVFQIFMNEWDTLDFVREDVTVEFIEVNDTIYIIGEWDNEPVYYPYNVASVEDDTVYTVFKPNKEVSDNILGVSFGRNDYLIERVDVESVTRQKTTRGNCIVPMDKEKFLSLVEDGELTPVMPVFD